MLGHRDTCDVVSNVFQTIIYVCMRIYAYSCVFVCLPVCETVSCI